MKFQNIFLQWVLNESLPKPRITNLNNQTNKSFTILLFCTAFKVFQALFFHLFYESSMFSRSFSSTSLSIRALFLLGCLLTFLLKLNAEIIQRFL